MNSENVHGLLTMQVTNMATFDKLKQKEFETTGRLLSTTVFEYPLGKSIALKDPSNNKFLLFEAYKP